MKDLFRGFFLYILERNSNIQKKILTDLLEIERILVQPKFCPSKIFFQQRMELDFHCSGNDFDHWENGQDWILRGFPKVLKEEEVLFSKFYGKVGVISWVTFPSHLKKLCSIYLLRLSSWKNTSIHFLVKISV